MSAIFRAAALLDRLGARTLVAKGVTLAYARRIPGLLVRSMRKAAGSMPSAKPLSSAQ